MRNLKQFLVYGAVALAVAACSTEDEPIIKPEPVKPDPKPPVENNDTIRMNITSVADFTLFLPRLKQVKDSIVIMDVKNDLPVDSVDFPTTLTDFHKEVAPRANIKLNRDDKFLSPKKDSTIIEFSHWKSGGGWKLKPGFMATNERDSVDFQANGLILPVFRKFSGNIVEKTDNGVYLLENSADLQTVIEQGGSMISAKSGRVILSADDLEKIRAAGIKIVGDAKTQSTGDECGIFHFPAVIGPASPVGFDALVKAVLYIGAQITVNKSIEARSRIEGVAADTLVFNNSDGAVNLSDVLSGYTRRIDGEKRIVYPSVANYATNASILENIEIPELTNSAAEFRSISNIKIDYIITDTWTRNVGWFGKQGARLIAPQGTSKAKIELSGSIEWFAGKSLQSVGIPDVVPISNYSQTEYIPYEIDVLKYLFVLTDAQSSQLQNADSKNTEIYNNNKVKEFFGPNIELKNEQLYGDEGGVMKGFPKLTIPFRQKSVMASLYWRER
jgi:hypothetical protein